MNKFTGERYIGLTTKTLEKRKRSHFKSVRKGSQLKFHKALRKFGKDSFKWRTVEKCNSLEELKEREKFWIKSFDSKNSGYNSTNGGELGTSKKNRKNKVKKKNKKIEKYLSSDEYTFVCLAHRLTDEEKNQLEEKLSNE